MKRATPKVNQAPTQEHHPCGEENEHRRGQRDVEIWLMPHRTEQDPMVVYKREVHQGQDHPLMHGMLISPKIIQNSVHAQGKDRQHKQQELTMISNGSMPSQ